MSTNMTDAITFEYDGVRIFKICLILMILIAGFGLNSIVLVVYFTSRAIKKVKTNVAVFNLIICDMIFIFLVIPMSVITITVPKSAADQQITDGPICQMTGFVSVMVCTVSSLSLTFIAIDRYLAAVHPIRYINNFTHKHCIVILGFCWIWGFLTALPPVLPSKPALYIYHDGTKHCSPSFRTHCWYFWYCILMGYGIPIPTMVFCYVQISRTLRKNRRKIFTGSKIAENLPIGIGAQKVMPENMSMWSVNTRDVSIVEVANANILVATTNTTTKKKNNSTSNNISTIKQLSKSTRVQPQIQIAKRGALLIMAYFLCWGPYAVLFACPGHVQTEEWVEVLAMWIVYSLTIWNPLIYVFNNKQFRYEVSRLYRKIKIRCTLVAKL